MTDFAAGSLPRFYPASGRGRSHAGRFAGIAAVVLLHLVVLYFVLFAHGPGRAAPPPAPLKVNLLDEVRPPPEALPPPPPPPALAPPPLPFIPPPEIVIQTPPPTAAPVRAATTVPQAAPAPVGPVVAAPAPPAPASQVKVQPDLITAESREPEYPSMSRRLREEGLVGLLVLVEPDGSVSDVRIEQSSGHDRLDQSAVEAAKSRSRFKPGTIDGKPAKMWFRYRYTFRLS